MNIKSENTKSSSPKSCLSPVAKPHRTRQNIKKPLKDLPETGNSTANNNVGNLRPRTRGSMKCVAASQDSNVSPITHSTIAKIAAESELDC